MKRLALEDGSYSAWMNEHFDVSDEGLRCKRCGMIVGYLTLHARNVHEDDINVLPGRGRLNYYDVEGCEIAPPSQDAARLRVDA